MTTRARDTTPEVADRYRALLLARPPSERLLMALRLFDLGRAAILGPLPDDIDEGTRRVHLFKRTYGRDYDEATAIEICKRLMDCSARRS
jgi:hypothetical protein